MRLQFARLRIDDFPDLDVLHQVEPRPVRLTRRTVVDLLQRGQLILRDATKIDFFLDLAQKAASQAVEMTDEFGEMRLHTKRDGWWGYEQNGAWVRTIEVANIIGGMDAMANPGVVEFQQGGRTHRIEALDEGEGVLFLVFADRTNGHGSYGAGRFLDAPMPDANGNVTLDFNQARNPPCAFTAFATCPLPPPENRLDLAITAGEKAYHKPTGP